MEEGQRRVEATETNLRKKERRESCPLFLPVLPCSVSSLPRCFHPPLFPSPPAFVSLTRAIVTLSTTVFPNHPLLLQSQHVSLDSIVDFIPTYRSTPNSPNSMGSAAMDESESDTSPGDIDDDAPLYPVEGKFRSEADRAEIMAMTEIEREEILADRAHEVQKRQQDQQLKRILARQKRDAASGDNAKNKKKRSGDAAGLTDDARGSRTKRSLNPALDKYKEQRQLKSDQKARGEERRREHRSPSRDDADSERDADAESEVEWDEKPPVTSREEPTAELRDFERVRVGRSNFARVCFYPTFESAIKGCFCRVNIGLNKETGEPQYRMAQVKGTLSPV